MSFYDDIHAQPRTLHDVVLACLGNQRPALNEAVRLLRTATRVRVSSMGSAYYSGIPLARLLARLRPNVELDFTADLLEQPREAGTVTVLLSRSGESGEIAQFAREKGVETLIAISMTPTSTLARHADCFIHDPATFDGLICTKAFTSLWLVGALLAYAYAGTLDAQADALIAFLAELDAWRALIDPLLRDSPFLNDLQMPYCLSHGFGLGIAQLGSLLLQEGTRVFSAADHMGMFHHGPVEIAGPTFKAFWIDVEPTARSEVYYRKVRGQNAQLLPLHCGAPHLGAEGIVLPGAAGPPEWRCLAAAMAMQFSVHHAAAHRGHVAGEMENLQWLVT